MARAEEAARLNPRGRRGRDAHPRFRATLTGLERCHLTLRTLARAILDRTYFVPTPEQGAAYTPAQRAALGDLLATAAGAIRAVAPIAAGGEAAQAARLQVEAHLDALDERRTRLAGLLAVDPDVDEAAWSQHGSLLAAVDQMRVEIAAAAREVEPPPAEPDVPICAPGPPLGRLDGGRHGADGRLARRLVRPASRTDNGTLVGTYPARVPLVAGTTPIGVPLAGTGLRPRSAAG